MKSGNLGPKGNPHRILRFGNLGPNGNLHIFEETARSAAKIFRIFRHKNEFLKGEMWYFRACRAKRGEKILHDFQRFLGPKRNLHGFWKTRILARKGTYIKSRFWILKGGSFRFRMVVSKGLLASFNGRKDTVPYLVSVLSNRSNEQCFKTFKVKI